MKMRNQKQAGKNVDFISRRREALKRIELFTLHPKKPPPNSPKNGKDTDGENHKKGLSNVFAEVSYWSPFAFEEEAVEEASNPSFNCAYAPTDSKKKIMTTSLSSIILVRCLNEKKSSKEPTTLY